jgi:hypothetical protein
MHARWPPDISVNYVIFGRHPVAARLVGAHVLTQRLHCTRHRAVDDTPAPLRTSRAHSFVVTPAGRRNRNRAHALVCGRTAEEPPRICTAAHPRDLATA